MDVDAGVDAMKNYDDLLDEKLNVSVTSFMPCKNSGLVNGLVVLYENNYKPISHPIVSYCMLSKKPYFTCCTYAADVECVSRHICSFIPVIIGSRLDKRIIKYLYPDEDPDSYDISNLYGTIYIDSSYCFSNLLTNRKELIHRVKRSSLPEVHELFIYDVDERGHKISMDNSGVITYRNRSGRDEVIPRFQPDDDSPFKLDGKFSIDDQHLMLHHIHEAFGRLYEYRINIDSLANKNIMSPVNILYKAIQYSRRNNSDVAKFMKFGMIEKFASLQISYQMHSKSRNGGVGSNFLHVDATKFNMAADTKRKADEDGDFVAKRQKLDNDPEDMEKIAKQSKNNKKKTYSRASSTIHESFNFKKIQPNQLGAISRTWYRHVVRPIPKNVPNIPIDTEFFICMAEKSMSIDSPNRWMVLLDDIYISNHLHNAKYMDINSLLLNCLAAGYFVQVDPDCELVRECCVVMVNGGLLTRFVLAANIDCEKLFFYIKSLHPFVEVYTTMRFMMLNLTDGIPFRRLSLGDQCSVFVSPLELMTSMKRFRNLENLNVLGPNCPDDIKNMLAYVTPSKLMSIVYFRNRFDNSKTLKFFPLTTENTCAFIDHIRCGKTQLYDPKESLIGANVIFSSNPQLTGDGYIISDQLASSVNICKRYCIEFQTNLDETNFIWPKTSIAKRTRNIYSSLGTTVIARKILVFEMIKFGSRLKYKIFPQIRLKIHEKNLSNHQVWAYRVEYWDDNCESFNENFNLSVICTTTNCRKKEKAVNVSVIAGFSDNNFDFKLSEMCGQKGIAVRQNTERFQRMFKLPSRPDVVSSVFSIVGRSPLIQLKCVARNSVSNSNILYGQYKYGILKNITSSVCSYNPMRIDWSLGKVLAFNNCCRTLYKIQQDSMRDTEKGKILPVNAHRALALMGIIKCSVHFTDTFDNNLRSLVHVTRKDFELMKKK